MVDRQTIDCTIHRRLDFAEPMCTRMRKKCRVELAGIPALALVRGSLKYAKNGRATSSNCLLRDNPELRPFVLSNVRLTGTTIGAGAYGSVEEVAIPGVICAAKNIHEIFLDRSEIPPSVKIRKNLAQFVRECQLMSTLRHPNIVQFLGVCFFPGTRLPALVMERLLTSLHDLLDPEIDPPPPSDAPKPFFPLSLKCSILHNVANGLAFLHERPDKAVLIKPSW